MKRALWISYDLGIKGDFPNLYAWLDNHDAKEAGNNLAFLLYEVEDENADIATLVRRDLKETINFDPGDRVYVVRLGTEIEKNSKRKNAGGRFIIGRRRSSPWEGYGDIDADSKEDNDE